MDSAPHTTELLAPAGGPDAGYAALAYGADAVYLGLERFSARAEAENFTPAQLDAFAAYAHSLGRRVYLTLNTLVMQRELSAAARTLLDAAACGIDAVIVQDQGIAWFIQKHFPGLALHASTQMAIHNVSGALAARALGFRRVTLARELTLAEIATIAQAVPDVQLEAFIHGTLCYSYSGLCLFSSIMTGRSGNRGRCVYSCREAADTPKGRAYPFSLRDLALGPRVLDVVRAGAASLKIEGRKKNALYVGATVDYYRRLLDGVLTPEQEREAAARLQTIFARRWTKLFIDGRYNPKAADTDAVGHRGSPVGTVEKLVDTPAGRGMLLRPTQALERHDGLQTDQPGEIYGFAVDHLYDASKPGRLREVYEASPGVPAAVPLPSDAPSIAPGAPVWLASSQAVKRAYPFNKPKPGAYRLRVPLRVRVTVEPSAAGACVRVAAAADGLEAEALEAAAPAFAARDRDGVLRAANAAFARINDTRFTLDACEVQCPEGIFVPQSVFNALRRQITDQLEAAWQARHEARGAQLELAVPAAPARESGPLRWQVYAQWPEALGAFTADDFARADEVILELDPAAPAQSRDAVDHIAQRAGPGKVRLALPIIVREHASALQELVAGLADLGWRKWLVPGLSGWQMLSGRPGLDLAADWPLYVLNAAAGRRLADMGFSACTLSPEDGRQNMPLVLQALPLPAAAVVWSWLPLFISAACAHSHLGLCPARGKRPAPACAAGEGSLRVRMERSGQVDVLPAACGSIVVGARPWSLVGRHEELHRLGVGALRVDLRFKPLSAARSVEVWRRCLAGVEPDTAVNFDRGLT